MRIGIIGTGAMGRPIAQKLLTAGHSVVVYNRTPERAEALRSRGAEIAMSVTELCKAEVIITMLADDTAVNAVVFESGQFLPAFDSERVHLSMSTISIAMARRLTAAHAGGAGHFVSAPVFGRPEAAEGAALSVVAAGPRPTIDRLSSLFAAIAKGVFVVGEIPLHANVVKICGNALLFSAVEALAEVLAFARHQGVDADVLLDLLTGTLFTAPFYRGYGRLMIDRQFTPPGFRLRLALKDVGLFLEESRGADIATPVVTAVEEQLARGVQRGLQESDVAALAELLDGRAYRDPLVASWWSAASSGDAGLSAQCGTTKMSCTPHASLETETGPAWF
jgi:3-hydroxyisobutyrate dehydrogenase-like beta-hydroxyacid dehydrogenase